MVLQRFDVIFGDSLSSLSVTLKKKDSEQMHKGSHRTILDIIMRTVAAQICFAHDLCHPKLV